VIDGSGEAGFAQETVADLIVLGDLRPNQLEGHLTVENLIAGAIDDAHAARPESAHDLEVSDLAGGRCPTNSVTA
jgi:hypothetical protein